jgi:hypothetical protein
MGRFASCLLPLVSLAWGASAASAELAVAEREAALKIVRQITAICEEKGLDACAPQIRGLDAIFDYQREYAAMKQTEQEFVGFVRRTYDLPDFEMTHMAAHVDPKIAITVGRATFDKVAAVRKVGDGYELQMADQATVSLRRESGRWVAHLSPDASEHMPMLKSYRVAARLKSSIMRYRMLEARMLESELEVFGQRFVSDLLPLVAAVTQKPEVIAQVPDWQKRLQEVLDFYRQFASLDDMRAHIAQRHSLKQ